MTSSNFDNGGKKTMLDRVLLFFLNNRLFVFIILITLIVWGVIVAPFDWDIPFLPRDPVPVDAIPDISENQQIVFTRWPGRSPQDIEDQITYPLSVSLLGIPGIKTIRSTSMFGFSTIYLIFNENVEFYWSRSRVLEKLNSLPAGILPADAQPSLGPDATALGQIFWYTVEGRDENGQPTGGWDLQELRSIQDWYIRYALMSAEGVSEAASVGGFVKEYQIDLVPDTMRTYGISLKEVIGAVRSSNLDVGARTMEINNVEYFIRGIGFIKTVSDIENTVIRVVDNIPVSIKDIARVTIGPAIRRGVLDKGGVEVVGGVVVARFGDNPLKVIKNVKAKIKEISPGLPQKKLADGRTSKVTIVPFYDRTELIYETLGTLSTALTEEVLVTIIVILLLVMHLGSSFLISALLPISVLISFIFMKIFGVDANIVALSGIAIAIGTIVDMGIVITENMLGQPKLKSGKVNWIEHIYNSTREVGGAVITALLTTVVSFLPVFTMEAAEGKLFRPLAYTKTFALVAALIVSICFIPPMAVILFREKKKTILRRVLVTGLPLLFGAYLIISFSFVIGFVVIAMALFRDAEKYFPKSIEPYKKYIRIGLPLFAVFLILSAHWAPLGIERGIVVNLGFVSLLIGGLITLFQLYRRKYTSILSWALDNKRKVIIFSLVLVFTGGNVWLGFNSFFGWMPGFVKSSTPYSFFSHTFPGMGKEFMPPLDEGSFLLMPTTMPHASIGEAYDVLRKQDMLIASLPEVDSSVGKIGRVDSPLDPAPLSMIETVINYKTEFYKDDGKIVLFECDDDEIDYFRDFDGNRVNASDGMPYKVPGKFARDVNGNLIQSGGGEPFRLWRLPLDSELNPGRKRWKGIESPDDIWDMISKATRIPGTTAAPKLQPINARIVMLQSGMRSPMGIKIKGHDLETIEKVGLSIEKFIKEIPSINRDTVFAGRIVGKPYLEIHIDRKAAARHGITIKDIQNVIEFGIGGKRITTTVEGRERYGVRVRFMRELRNSIEEIGALPVSSPKGYYVPLREVSRVEYVRGPQAIKSEDTFLVSYVLFDRTGDVAEVDVVEQAAAYLKLKEDTGELVIPGGVSYSFAGTYENQVRAERKLKLILPLSLVIIFLILYFKFRSVANTFIIFSGILVAWSGGFIMLWLYNQPWFLDFSLFGANMRELFQIHPVNLSVAIWVGFLALFGIASDDGVVMMTYLTQKFKGKKFKTKKAIRAAVIEGANRRVRPALMTTATTILALLPVLTSTGRGANIMISMAIPTFGGMFIAILTTLITPVMFGMIKERG